MSLSPQSRDDITVVIPAAGKVPEGVLSLSNISCSALIPVAGRPVIFWILRYLTSLGFKKFVIAVPSRGLFIEDFVACTIERDCECRFIVPPDVAESGLGDTVQALLATVRTKSALVVLGDTSFQLQNPDVLQNDEPFILTAAVQESYRWCVAESDAEGRLKQLHDKVAGLPQPLQALIGVYFFPDARRVRDVLASRREHSPASFAQLLEAVHDSMPIRVRVAAQWIDVGNPDRQANANVELLQKREFNTLSIDPVYSTIRKSSRHQVKFIDEINYLRLLPREIAVFFPRLVDYSLEWDDLSMTMEYYGYSTLAEVFIYENADPGLWGRVFSQLLSILQKAFARYRYPISREMMIGMYLGKTRDRLQALEQNETLRPLIHSEEPLWINGRACPSLMRVWPAVEEEVSRITTAPQGQIIHGDLCFSNILYDLRTGVCKLIDPRGSFGIAGIFGDTRYDVAKLYHSVFGLYDFITNDLFHIRVQGNEVALDVRSMPQHRKILERFEHVFFGPFDRREILLITALIFTSIPALHYDHPRRQVAMLATALHMFGELFPVNEG